MRSGGVVGEQFKKCIHAQCQQIRTLMQIEFTINPPGAAIEEEKKKERRGREGKKAKKMKMEILAL